jgi:tetratricopeptide (TPR) repeat protein
VAVLEVGPNRLGRISLEDPALPARLEACRQSVRRHPHRADILVRLAELLHRARRDEEALGLLRAFLGSHGPDVGVYRTTGAILLDLGRHAEALEAFQDAARLPGADVLARTIRRGIERAAEGQGLDRAEDPVAAAQRLSRSARDKMRVLAFRAAWDDLERARRLLPDDPGVGLLRAEVLVRAGRAAEARKLLERASRAGLSEATRRLLLLQRVAALESSARTAATPAELLELATILLREGTPGRALALLEEAAPRFPDSVELLLRLAELYLFYGRPELSEPLYRRVLERETARPEARRGLEASLALLRPATF